MSDSEDSCRDDSELVAWISEFSSHLEPKQQRQVHDTLKANGFTTRLKLKLIGENELNIMFTCGEALPLATKSLLTFKLNSLRDESSLVSKWKPRVDMEINNATASKKVSTHLNLKCI